MLRCIGCPEAGLASPGLKEDEKKNTPSYCNRQEWMPDALTGLSEARTEGDEVSDRRLAIWP
jgi:hypothetical protein